MREHDIVTITGDQGYPLQCRYWVSPEPSAVIIMVHGVISHSLWLESVAERLADRQLSVLAMDRRGSGLNQDARGDAPSSDTLLRDLDAVFHWAASTALPVHLCGFCWGGNYVINYLNAHRVHVQSLTLIAPSIFASALIKQQRFATGDSAAPTEQPVTPIDQFTDGPMYESFIRPDPLRLRKVSLRFNRCIEQFANGLWMKFVKLNLPCLVLLAARDSIVDNQATERAFHRLKAPCKQLQTLNGGHGLQFDEATQIAAHIIQWVDAAAREQHNGRNRS
jgi:alpha-beta hydrolase superfamily lysophospholipase